MKWQFEKFKGDMAIYGICPKCGFIKQMSAFDLEPHFILYICGQYHYCPKCGEYLYDDDEPEVIWNERDIEEEYEIKENNFKGESIWEVDQ